MSEKIKILIVDDDPQLLAVLETGLGMQSNYAVQATSAAHDAIKRIESKSYDLIVTDYSLGDPDIDGLKILKTAHQLQPHCLVTIITAYASLEISIEAIHLGAYDFLTKPFQLDEFQLMVRNAAHHIQLDHENSQLREELSEMAMAMEAIEQQHADLLVNLRQWDDENRTGAASAYSVANRIEEENVQDYRRRQLHSQISTYIRMGETIREQVARERQRIESMFQRGLLSEELYRRALSKHLDTV